MADTALLVIDIQNDYFPGGAMELEGAEAAGAKAGEAIRRFRQRNLPVIHVRHLSVRPGATFFVPGTRLEQLLKDAGVQNLVVAGMMTHMCVDASVRHAADHGYKVTLLGDACATRAQTFEGETVPARQVHAAFLAALNGFYAKVIHSHDL